MTIVMARAYQGYRAGDVVQLNTPTEAALIQQGYAYISVQPITSGDKVTLEYSGRVVVPAGATSVVVSNPNFRASSKMMAYVAQPSSDATATRVARIVAASGSITIYMNAATTANTIVDWSVPSKSGMAASSLQRNSPTYPSSGSDTPTIPSLPYDPVFVLNGDSQARGTADDQATYIASYVADPKVQILNAAGAFVQYTPGVSGGSGLAYGSNDTGVGPEIGFIQRFRAAYPNNTIYIIKEGNPGAFQARGPVIGGAFNITSPGGNAYTANSGALSGSNTLITGAGIETGVYIPFTNFLSVAGLNGGRSGAAFGPVAVTQYNATLSWSPTEGLCYNGNSGNINNAARQRLVNAMATLVSGGKTPVIVATLLVLGTNDKTDTGSTATFQTDTTAYINQYRAGWTIPSVPTTMARVTNSGAGGATVRAAQLAVKGVMSAVGLVNMDAQPVSADAVHWRIAGLQAMGQAAFDFTYGNANGLLL